jgi:predicted phosphate transport protein (TIGR00153 family)
VRLRLTPRDETFFDMFASSANNLVAAAAVLADLVPDSSNREKLADQMRDLEHVGDTITHRIYRQLNSSFITPFDREDIYNLASNLDDVMDALDAAADLVVLTKLGALPREMLRQVELLAKAAEETAAAMPRLKTMTGLEPYWIEVNRLENEADKTYRKLVSRLYTGEYDALTVLKLKEVADNLEAAADAFEHVANVVETIAVKES